MRGTHTWLFDSDSANPGLDLPLRQIGEGSITFPHGFTKNSREHTIPIGPLAENIIGELPQTSDLLFPSRYSNDTVFSGWSKTKCAFDKEIEIAELTANVGDAGFQVAFWFWIFSNPSMNMMPSMTFGN